MAKHKVKVPNFSSVLGRSLRSTMTKSQWEKNRILNAMEAWEHVHGEEPDPVHRRMTAKQLKDRFLMPVAARESLYQATILTYRQTTNQYKLNRQAIERWYAMDINARWCNYNNSTGFRPPVVQASNQTWFRDEHGTLKKTQKASAQWWLSDLENMRLHYVELRDDHEALQALFPGHTIQEIEEQAIKMNLVPKRSSPSRQGKRAQVASHRSRQTPYKRSWRKEEDELLTKMYPIFGTNVQAWPKQLHGRKKDDIVNRAQELGLKPPENTNLERSANESLQKWSRRKFAHLKGNALNERPWEDEENQLLERMYPVYGSDMKAWTKKLYGRKKADIEKQASKLGLTYNA